MEKKHVNLGKTLAISGLSITPVVEIAIYGWQDQRGFSFLGFKKPLYVLISTPQSPLQAFTMTGESVSPEKIVKEYPELDNALLQ